VHHASERWDERPYWKGGWTLPDAVRWRHGRGVPGFRDLLSRFRPAAAPGPAGAAGVPTDRRDAVAAELAPVFAALAEVEQECDRLRRAARLAASAREATAAEQARVMIARARDQAAADRAAAAVRVREAAAAELAQLAASTEAAAEEVRRRSAQRLPGLVASVVERVRAELAALDPEHR
jgi:flagellar biosynthesis/type III secretory pathway protein FliH